MSLHDPEIFVTECAAIFIRYPLDVGEQAVAVAKRSSPKFVPSIPEIEIACRDANAAREYLREWNNRAAQQANDNRRLPPIVERPGTLTNFEEAVAQYGRPIGPFEKGTPYEQYAGKRVSMPKKDEWKRFTADDLMKLYERKDEAAE